MAMFAHIVLKKTTVFDGYLPCNLFAYDIPVVRMTGAGIDALCPIWCATINCREE